MEEAKSLFQGTDISITCEGSRYLGAAIGTSQFCQDYVNNKVRQWTDEVLRLAEIARSQPQAAYSALCQAIRSKWSFVCRTMEVSEHALEPLEKAIHHKLIGHHWPLLTK